MGENKALQIKRVLDIVSSFNFKQQTLSAKGFSEVLDIPLSTLYRYLTILVARGFLIKEPDTQKYRLGYQLLKLGRIAGSNMEFIDIIRPHMERLSSDLSETILLTVISGWESVCVERIEAGKRIRMTLERGTSLPLHAGASSKILLAYQDDSFLKTMINEVGVPRITANTIVDIDELKQELKKIREQGFALSDQEADLGAGAISAPIFDHRDTVIAGIAVVAHWEKIVGKDKECLIAMILDAAKKASFDLG